MQTFLLSCSNLNSISLLRPNSIVLPQPTKTRRSKVSCDAKNGANNKRGGPEEVDSCQRKLDRRNVLLGMGGLYGAANLSSGSSSAASAADLPIIPPDLYKCKLGTNLNTGQPLDEKCCQPPNTPVDYKLPPVKVMKCRPAAHLVTKEYVSKYELALCKMKGLDPDDPRSFKQQANVHCAYCNLSYFQTDKSDSKDLQVHNSWHFFPWHRWYIYFFERILGSLIDDPTFGLPFWNWDNPPGMVMPDMFTVKSSPLYDKLRNPDHYPPATANLSYNGTDDGSSPQEIINNNLALMYRTMISNAKNFEDFYGAKYVIGTDPDPGAGTVEVGPHNAMHRWVGTATRSGEDMGNFYSSGKEPLFYSLHAQVDRLWSISRELRRKTGQNDEFPKDWSEASYVFYDENAQLVRVKNSDNIDHLSMGYDFQKVELPWLKRRPAAKVTKSKVAKTSSAPAAAVVFPVTLDKTVKVLVDRPKKSRSKKDKEEEEELLLIEGIEADTSDYVKFDVFIDDEDDQQSNLDKAEFAGTFSLVPHKNAGKAKVKIRFGLTDLLEDLDVEGDDQILVTLVPKSGGEGITIGGIKIVYDKPN